MRNLTPKQEAFCQALVKPGPDGRLLSLSDAYRLAYSCGRMKAETVNNLAYRLSNRDEIRARLEELRRPAVEAVGLTLEEHLRNLERLREEAIQAEQIGAAVSAEVARGKAAGLYKEKVEHSGGLLIGWEEHGNAD